MSPDYCSLNIRKRTFLSKQALPVTGSRFWLPPVVFCSDQSPLSLHQLNIFRLLLIHHMLPLCLSRLIFWILTLVRLGFGVSLADSLYIDIGAVEVTNYNNIHLQHLSGKGSFPASFAPATAVVHSLSLSRWSLKLYCPYLPTISFTICLKLLLIISAVIFHPITSTFLFNPHTANTASLNCTNFQSQSAPRQTESHTYCNYFGKLEVTK